MACVQRRLAWWWVALLAFAVGAALLGKWRPGGVTPVQPDAVPVSSRATQLPVPAAPAPAAGRSDDPVPGKQVDPVGRALDLKRVFDGYVTADDPRQRRVAQRAFEACVPAFLGPAGEMASVEGLVRALPPDRRDQREAAYRELYARCHRLVEEDRASLLRWQKALQAEPALQEPGLRAQAELVAGQLAGIEALVAEASGDPAALLSLSGLAERLARRRQPEDTDPALLRQARAVDAALPGVACDLGLDCSAQSLLALQLCAAQGACDGDVPARLMDPFSPEAVDPLAVQAQRARLLAWIRSGRPLHLTELLP